MYGNIHETLAETPREKDVVRGVDVPPGHDPRLVRSELRRVDESPTEEGAGGTQDDSDAGHGGTAGYTTSCA